LLVEISLIGLGDDIGPQALAHVHGVGHGGDGARVSRLQLIDEFDDAAELLDYAIEFLQADLQSGQVSDLLDVLPGQFHFDWLNSGWIGLSAILGRNVR
jgi:hypothetical protein